MSTHIGNPAISYRMKPTRAILGNNTDSMSEWAQNLKQPSNIIVI